MTVTERERRRMELVDGSAHRTELCELLAMREFELDNLKDENAKLRELCEQLAMREVELDNLRERYERLHRAVDGAMRELKRGVVR